MTVKTRKKLIEVALPLEAINVASAREKSIRHGHPSTLHLWWARRPLAAARAVIFAQMVDDPSSWPELFPSEKAQKKERDRLFAIIEDLVKWENTTDEEVLQKARDEIWQSWRRTCAENADHPRAKELFDRYKLPAFHDPFAGGGTLPLEAQRLGLESYASDLNPVAVLINKAMIEIPPKFAGKPPVNPKAQSELARGGKWNAKGAQGLADDVRYYGQWMRDEAEKRIGHLYPKVKITAEMAKERPDLEPLVGQELTVVAWLWARTVKSPNPAFAHVDVPLATSFMLSTKAGKEAYIEPIIGADGYRFAVKTGKPTDTDGARHGTTASKWNAFRCLMSDTPIPYSYIRNEGIAGRVGTRLMAVVVEGRRERIYISPTPEIESVVDEARPEWGPELDINHHPRDIKTQIYGLTRYRDLFTPRQLVAMTTFSDLVCVALTEIRKDAVCAGLSSDCAPLHVGEMCASSYSDAVSLYLACAVDYAANYWSTIATPAEGFIRGTFSRQALPMTWDYAEAPPFGNTSGNWLAGIEWVSKAIAALPSTGLGFATQADAAAQSISQNKLVSTDPPYYDNIGYADLSDYFYVWMRRSLHDVLPELFTTLATPKSEELVATPYRHGNRKKAEKFFLDGMTRAMNRLAEEAHPAFPVTIYYAFKQSETENAEGTASTGWETFLDATIRAGFAISGTLPMRTERSARSIGISANALASSVVLVCRPRSADAKSGTRREFVNALKAKLPEALRLLQAGNTAPVDLAQAAIGPGMAIYTSYADVLDAEGKQVSVRDALSLINATLDEVLAEQEGDFDADSRWALAWFEQNGFAEGDYGDAETLSKAKNISVAGLVDAGFLESKRGKVRLLKPEELPEDWDPATDKRLTAWEGVHHLIRVLANGGEGAAADLVTKLGTHAETARELAYRLYTLCERKKRSAEALAYNGLVQSWPEIIRLARQSNVSEPVAPVEPTLF